MASLLAALVLSACHADKADTADTDPGDTTTGTWAWPAESPWLGICDVYDVDAITAADVDGADVQLDELVDLGIRGARPHRTRGNVFAFNVVAPTPGTYDFSLTDHEVLTAGNLGITLTPTIYPYADLPSLADDPPGLIPIRVPDDVPGYQAFVQALVERYDGDGIDDVPGLIRPIHTWEIGNEPVCEEGADCAQVLVDLLADSYGPIKAADPDAIVIPAGAAPVYGPDGKDFGTDLWPTFVADGGLQYTDLFSFHVSIGSTTEDVDAYLSRWRDVIGDEVPMQVGELGTRPHDGSTAWTDPNAEAAWLTTQLDEAHADGLVHADWCRSGQYLARAPVEYAAVKAWIGDHLDL